MEKKFSGFLFIIAMFFFGIVLVKTDVHAATLNETENNDSYDNANVMSVGDVMCGKLYSERDEDFFKVTATEKGYISFSFTHPYAASKEDDLWYFTIFKFNKEKKEYDRLGDLYKVCMHDVECFSLPKVGVEQGEEFYIKVYGGSWGSSDDVINVNYSINVVQTKSDYYEHEFNDDYDSANVLKVNKKYTATLNDRNDKDYYKVVATETGYLTFSLIHPYAASLEDDSWVMSIYKFDDKKKTFTNVLTQLYVEMSDAEEFKTPKMGVKKGEIYYIAIRTRDWGGSDDVIGVDYSVKVTSKKTSTYEHEFNDVYDTANTIKVNQAYKASFYDDYDTDFFKVVSPETGTLTLSFEHPYKSDVKNEDWGLCVYSFNKKTKEYVPLFGGSHTISLSSPTTYIMPTLKIEKGDVFFVKVYGTSWRGSEGVVGIDYTIKAQYYPNKPTSFKANPTTNKVKFSWKKASSVDGYVIYKYDSKNKKYTKVKQLKNNVTTYTVEKLKESTKYTYAVRSFKKVGETTYYSEYVKVTTCTKPGKVKGFKVKALSKGKVEMSFTKQKDVSGYQVYCATSKNGKYSKLTETTKNKFTNSKLSKGKTYYLKVRAFKKDGKAYYNGAFSDIVKVKTKK